MTYSEMLERESWSGQTRKAHGDDEEHRIQSACVQWFRLQYPHLAKRLFAVPNGSYKSPSARGKMKAEGLLAGVADLVLLKPGRRATTEGPADGLAHPYDGKGKKGEYGKPTRRGTAGNGGCYGALLIEMKTEKKSSKQEAVQKEWEADVTKDGEYLYVVCRSLEEFMAAVRGYLGPATKRQRTEAEPPAAEPTVATKGRQRVCTGS